jgi:WD40 repeat protein
MALNIDQDNKLLYYGTKNGGLNIYDLNSSKISLLYLYHINSNLIEINIKNLENAHLDCISSLTLKTSQFFVSTGHDCSVKLWDFRNFDCYQEWTHHRKKWDEGIWEVKYREKDSEYSNELIATCGADGLIKIYEK